MDIKHAINRKFIRIKTALGITLLTTFFQSYAFTGKVLVQLGGFWDNLGKSQHINIDGLIGDTFTTETGNHKNALFGLGYFIDGLKKEKADFSYGVNFFYLPKTSISGSVVQENLFSNLSYQYSTVNYPLYAMVRSIIQTPNQRLNMIIDAGIGPNFMQLSEFNESPINNSTIPDHIFTGHTSTTFSATVGASIRLNQLFGSAPVECGYRFFYLGQGHLNIASNQVRNTLETGNNYANAIICAISI